MRYNLAMVPFDGKLENPKKIVQYIFVLVLAISEIRFHMFDLEKVGQDHGVQLSQWYH